MDSLDNESSRTDFTKSTYVEIEARQLALGEIIEESKNRGVQIDETYLLNEMKQKGYLTYNRGKLYQDRLAIDSDNNYIRHFLPRYSRYQEDIANSLDEMEQQCIELFNEDWIITRHIVRQTKDGEFRTIITEDHNLRAKLECIKTIVKVVELKQKHCEGQNIQISAVIIGKELQQMKAKIQKLKEENEQLTASGAITDESEKKKEKTSQDSKNS